MQAFFKLLDQRFVRCLRAQEVGAVRNFFHVPYIYIYIIKIHVPEEACMCDEEAFKKAMKRARLVSRDDLMMQQRLEEKLIIDVLLFHCRS